MLFASTWRFAFAFGMGRMGRELQQQQQQQQQVADATAAEDSDGEDPYLSSSTCHLWADAAAHGDATAPLATSSSVASERTDDPPPPSSRREAWESDRKENEESAGEAVPAIPRCRCHDSTADFPSLPTTALDTPVSASAEGFPATSARRTRRPQPFTTWQHLFRFHDSAASPLPLACAAANPSLRLAVETTGSLHVPNGHTSTTLSPTFLDAAEADTRVVHSPSLRSFLAYATVAMWWLCRPTTLRRRGAAAPQDDRAGGVTWSRRAPRLRIVVSAMGSAARADAGAVAKTAAPERASQLAPLAQQFEEILTSLVVDGVSLNAEIHAVGPCAFPPALLSLSSLLTSLRTLRLPRNKLLTDTLLLGQLHQLRDMDLSYSSVTSLAGLTADGNPHLQRVVVKGCKGLLSLSPLGELPRLHEVVASQSGVTDIAGLSRSRCLVVGSFYGCLGLDDLSPLGAIPTLREAYASESNVTGIHGLGRSRSLVHLGLRYCDLGSLEAIASLRSLKVLNVSYTPILSVQCLAQLPALEHIDISGCAQLRDIGPLGAIATLEEICASSSGVAVVRGLGRAQRLRSLLLSDCQELRALPGLGACAELEVVEANSSGLADIAGLEGGDALTKLDVSFCKRLEDLSVLLRLPALRKVRVEGSAGAASLNLGELQQRSPGLCIDISGG